MINPSQQLKQKGMSTAWQFYIGFVVIIALVTPLFFNNQELVYALLMISHPILFAGVFKGFCSHRKINIPRSILAIGIGLVIVGQNLQHFIYFELPISEIVALYVEESGIVLITIFAYFHIYMFERKFNIKGFSIDYTLLIISVTMLILIVTPNLLHTIIHDFNFSQKVAVFNLFVGATVLTLSVIHYLLTRSIGLTDGVRIMLTIY